MILWDVEVGENVATLPPSPLLSVKGAFVIFLYKEISAGGEKIKWREVAFL